MTARRLTPEEAAKRVNVADLKEYLNDLEAKVARYEALLRSCTDAERDEIDEALTPSSSLPEGAE